MSRLELILRKLGADKLTRLYGESRVAAISNIMHDGVNEINLVNLLNIKYGQQILAEKNIRTAVYAGLTNSEKRYVLTGESVGEPGLSREQLINLANLNWGNSIKSSHRLVEVLGLDQSYLPAKYIMPPSKENILPDNFLFPHQQRVKDEFVRKLSTDAEKLLIHMPTGAGKTRTCIEGVVDYWKANANRKKNIVWLAHSEELCEQAVETFIKIWKVRGESELNIHRLWGGHAAPDFKRNNGIIVAGFQKLYSLLSSPSNETFSNLSMLKGSVEILVVDEAHKAIAPTYQVCIEYLLTQGKTKLIGLTATPGRETNFIEQTSGQSETGKLAEFFDSQKIGLTDDCGNEVKNPIDYLQSLDFLSKINRKKVTTNIVLELNEKETKFVSEFLELPSSVLSKLADSDERNALILAEIASLSIKKRQTIVFALSVDHAHLITELLNLKGIRAKCIDGKTPPSEREKSLEEYKENKVQVLVNFGVLTTGFDAPNTNGIVIARPTQSLVLYSQMIGRGIRGPRVGGTAECDLVDLEDNLLGFPSEQQAFNHFNNAWRKQNG